MMIAVISGKGGTGKSTVAATLAHHWAQTEPVLLADCDVEGPNAHLLTGRDVVVERFDVTLPIPVIDHDQCTLCNACVDFCEFNALLALPKGIHLVESACHSCGGCTIVCPTDAITEKPRRIGEIRYFEGGQPSLIQGILDVGEQRGTPMVEATLDAAAKVQSPMTIIDGPPGASCSVAEVVKRSDLSLLVTEPTPFGLHDLVKAIELVQERNKPAAVIINRAQGEEAEQPIVEYCEAQGIPILLRIPHERAYAEAYARGEIVQKLGESMRSEFAELQKSLKKIIASKIVEAA